MIAAGAGRAGPRDRRSVGLTEQVGQELGQEAVTVPSYSAASAIGRDLSRTSRPAACGRRLRTRGRSHGVFHELREPVQNTSFGTFSFFIAVTAFFMTCSEQSFNKPGRWPQKSQNITLWV